MPEEQSFPSSAPELTPASPIKSQRRLWLIVAGLGVIAILVVVITGYLLLKRSSVTKSVSSPSPLPSASTVLPRQKQLSVVVNYVKGAQFTLSIGDIKLTDLLSNTAYMTLKPDATYSILSILDKDGAIVAQTKFSMPISASVDSVNTGGGTVAINKSSLNIVFNLPRGQTPARAVVSSANNKEFDHKDFVFSQLSELILPGSVVSPSVSPSPTSKPLSLVPAVLLDLLQTNNAYAANDELPYTIAVINDAGVSNISLYGVNGEVNSMAKQLDPWNKHQINVIPIVNSVPLNCAPISLNGGNQYANCADGGLVMSVVRATVPNANTAVVVTSQPGNNGSVILPYPVAAVSSGVSTGVVSHELGHAVGLLSDEYLWQFPGTVGFADPNCFPDMNSCKMATITYTDSNCSMGCNAGNTVRPGNYIMANNYTNFTYGGFDANELNKQITKVTSMVASPTPTPSPTPVLTTTPTPTVTAPLIPTSTPIPTATPVPTPVPSGKGIRETPPLYLFIGAPQKFCTMKGDNIALRLVARNYGKEPVKDVTLQMNYPAETSFLFSDPQPDIEIPNDHMGEFHAGEIAPGDFVSYILQVKINGSSNSAQFKATAFYDYKQEKKDQVLSDYTVDGACTPDAAPAGPKIDPSNPIPSLNRS